jgi:hypothetical protein
VNQAETVREELVKLTGAKFAIANPSESHPGYHNVEWFIRCTDIKMREIAHVNSVWKEEKGPIWVESYPLGDTIEWIELAYGEEAAVNSLDTEYSDFQSKESQAEFSTLYPLVMRRILRYEDLAADISTRRKVHVELKKSGSKGIVVFTLAAKITDFDSKSLEKKLEMNIEALKEAFQLATQE